MTGQSVVFRGGVAGLVAVLALGLVEATGTRFLQADSVGPSLPAVDIPVTSALVSLLVLVGVLWVLEWETVTPRELGLGVDLLLPAGALVIGAYAVFNGLAAGLAVLAGVPGSIDYHWTIPLHEAVVWLVIMFVLAGILEELLFRGYLQTKLVAVLGGPRLARVGVAIAITSALFSLYHVPRIILSGPPGGMSPAMYLFTLGISGLAYGVLYEWTQNLWVPILVHTFGNAPGTAGLLFVVAGGWPAWAAAGYQLLLLVTVVGALLLYRRIASARGVFPVWTARRDATLG